MYITVDNNFNYNLYDSVKALSEATGIKASTLTYHLCVKKRDKIERDGLTIVKVNLTVSKAKKRFKKFATIK